MEDISDIIYNMKKIVEEWPEKNVRKAEGNLEEHIRKKFVYVLKTKLELSQEEVGWFKIKLDDGVEQFIFRSGKRTSEDLKEILDIFDGRNVAITPREEYTLIKNFARILPYPLLESEGQVCIDIYNKRIDRIAQAVCDYYRRSQVEELYLKRLFVEIDAKLEPDRKKRQEFYKNQYIMVKKWKEKWMFVMEGAGGIRIAERIECLYKSKEGSRLENFKIEEKNFCKTGKSKNESLQTLYMEMKKIGSKDLCQYMLGRFAIECTESEKIKKETLENVRNREGCREECIFLFGEVIGHYLKNNAMEDFEYMTKEAIKELDIIETIFMQDYKAQERRENSIYPEVELLKKKSILSNIEKEIGKVVEKDFRNLANIRRHLNEVENERILITDYL